MLPWLVLAAAAFAAPATHHPAWEDVLRRFVDDQGRVDFAALRRDPAPLRAQVDFVAKTSPDAFDSRDGKLAYLLNAYNALAMSRAAHSGLEPASKLRFFYVGKQDVGGRLLTLRALENEVIRPMGEPKIHFALNCMARGCPRLPQEPFRAESLKAQLEKAAAEFVGSPKHVQVDAESKTVKLSSIFKWYKQDFLLTAPSLLGFVNGYRAEKIPDGYGYEFLPYDWSLNAR